MRHPNSGLSEDDLSRLTGSSLSPESCSSNGCSDNGSSSSPSSTPSHHDQQQQQQQAACNGALVSTNSSPLSSAAATTATAPAAHASSAPHNVIDAELLKNLKNTSTHSHSHALANANASAVNGNGHGHSTNIINNNHNHNNNHSTAGSHFNSSYLPEFIDPLDWQKSRKRKERLDSTSSATQDRKLIRSNSEELLTNDDDECPQQDNEDESTAASLLVPTAATATLKLRQQVDAIRRVASEDFKKTPSSYDLNLEASSEADGAKNDDNPIEKGNSNGNGNDEATLLDGGNENDAYFANRHQHEPFALAYSQALLSGPTKDMTRRSRFETSPARSYRHSPNRGALRNQSDDSEYEHERRRNSERFCKSRAPPGRKAAGIVKKNGKMHGAAKLHGDENVYKYDISALKHERRGFVSKKTTVGERCNGADFNDNNLIDFHVIGSGSGSESAVVAAGEMPTAASAQSSGKDIATTIASSNIIATSAEALPWERSPAADQSEPMLSRRYATARHHLGDSIDTAAKLSKVMPYPQQFHKQTAAQLLAADDCLEPLDTYRAFTSLENLKTREVMQQVIPAMMSFQSPEERLKQISKRLTALKKKLLQFEEAFEARTGYRPSHVDKLNDKFMKNVLAELSKLRKEKHQLKSDPMEVLGMKVRGDMDAAKKLEQMQAALNEIEQDLSEKRKEANRSEVLDDLTAEQLLHEKSAVQHDLLYFESLYGRPSTKEERDAARPLYDRYRQLKRLVSRSVALFGSAAASELPTILEHEAMVFESPSQQQQQPQQQQYLAIDNADGSNNSPTNTASNGSEDSANNSASTTTTTTTASQPHCGENISALSIDQLWEQLEKTSEEKKLLKRTIREYETAFEEQNGRKMLKHDRKIIEETYAQYKEKKSKTRLLQALIKKQISR